MKIIGITGTLGAGKGTIVDYLTKHHKFQHFSVREYLSKIIKSRGGEVNRDSLVATANEERPVRCSTLSSRSVRPSNSVAPGLNTAFTILGKSAAVMIGLPSKR